MSDEISQIGASIDEDEAKVFFSHGETLVMIGHLTNAILSTNSAVALLAEGKHFQVPPHLENSGKQVDQILKIMRDKLGPEVVTNE